MQWIIFTIWAAVMQSIRAAGQKKLAESLSVWTVSYVRFIFGLPFAFCFYLFFKPNYQNLSINTALLCFVLIAALAQLIGTYYSVLLLGRRNFATGSTLINSEAMFTAILGWILFAEYISLYGWLAVLLNVSGLMIAIVVKQKSSVSKLVSNLDSKSALYGLTAGVSFAIASLCIRQATLNLPEINSVVARGVYVLFLVLIIQTILSLAMIMLKQHQVYDEIKNNVLSCGFIGLTSMLGSFGWFVAYSLQNAAYVKVLGQVEFIFFTIITLYYFKEKISKYELIAMLLILSSILLLLL